MSLSMVLDMIFLPFSENRTAILRLEQGFDVLRNDQEQGGEGPDEQGVKHLNSPAKAPYHYTWRRACWIGRPVQRRMGRCMGRPVQRPVQRPMRRPVRSPMQRPVQRPMQRPVQRPILHP